MTSRLQHATSAPPRSSWATLTPALPRGQGCQAGRSRPDRRQGAEEGEEVQEEEGRQGQEEDRLQGRDQPGGPQGGPSAEVPHRLGGEELPQVPHHLRPGIKLARFSFLD